MKKHKLFPFLRWRMCNSLLATLLATTLSLAGCSADNNETADHNLPEGKYPMTFSTAVEGLSVTRATVDNTWEGNESVAVQVDGAVKKYKPANGGTSTTLQAAEPTTPFYWQASNETKAVSAWCTGTGYVNAVPATWTVQPDQSSAGYQQSDFLYAPETSISFANRNTALTFYHQTAKVVINILNADAVTDARQITGVSLVNMNTTADYAAPQDGNTAGTWSNLSTPAGNEITPKTLAATPGNTGNILQSYAALVIPQDMANKKFIKVTANGNDYYYTPSAGDATLQSGKQHTYNITVKNGYLEVVTVSDQGGAWGNGDGKVEEILSKSLAVGDFYMKDGSVIPGSTETLTEGQKANCIGVVFWVGDATAKDKTLKADHPECTHGLVVALKDAIETGEGTTKWQDSYVSVQDWLTSNRSGVFLNIQGSTDANDPVLNNIQGYNNTKAIEAYNSNSGQAPVLPVQNAVLAYRNDVPAPDNSSNWYLPSVKELSLLVGSDVPDIGHNNSGGTGTYDLLNGNSGQFDKLGSYAAKIEESTIYWSSTELDGNYVYIINNGAIALGAKTASWRLRCILAF